MATNRGDLRRSSSHDLRRLMEIREANIWRVTVVVIAIVTAAAIGAVVVSALYFMALQ